MSTIRDLIVNPSKINNTTLNTVNHNYQAALRQSQIVIEDDMLIFKEPVRGGSVAAKSKFTAYSILAPRKISNLCIFEYTYVYSNIHGHFVDDYRI